MGLIGPLTKLQGEKRLRPIIIPAMWFQARIQAAFPNVWNSVGSRVRLCNGKIKKMCVF
jgi:hypothetical protein